MSAGPQLLISAGEPSGDRHAARFLDAFRARHPDVEAFGLGGPELRARGMEIVAAMEDLAVVGLVEVIRKIPRAMRALSDLAAAAAERRPDLVVPVDFPDFNLRLAARVRARGLKVLYYISPQVWAWRESRIPRIRRDTDRLAVVFPFEVEFYRRRGMEVDFVGHPLIEEMPAPEPAEAFRARLGLDRDRPLVALLPGSREGEVTRHWPLLLETVRRLRSADPAIQFVSALAPGLTPAHHPVPDGVAVRVVAGEEHALLQAADAALVAAGTATLEALLAGCPMVVFYRAAPITFALMRRMVKVSHVGLANLIGGEDVAPELIQDSATPEALAAAVLKLLADPGRRRKMEQIALRVRQELGGGSASGNLTRLAEEMLWPDA